MTRPLRVYLAGGFVSGWQDRVKRAVLGVDYFDPREHGLPMPGEATEADLRAIRHADVLFAHLEPDNPGGYAMAFEAGYAARSNDSKIGGNTLVLITGKVWDMYPWRMVLDAAHLVEPTLAGGILRLIELRDEHDRVSKG